MVHFNRAEIYLEESMETLQVPKDLQKKLLAEINKIAPDITDSQSKNIFQKKSQT